MTQEQKARAYDEAIGKLRDFYRDYDTISHLIDVKEELANLFPELKESEDERIRKEIIAFIKKRDRSGCDYDYDQWIAWLEKQVGQQTSLPKWKYKRGDTPLLRDWLVLNKYGCVLKALSGAIISNAWVLDYDELLKLPKEELEKQGEQKPAYRAEPKTLDPDKVIEWLENQACQGWIEDVEVEKFVDKFKKDFGL